MKRKMIAILCALLVLQGLSVATFASATPTFVPMPGIYSGASVSTGSGFMWDSEGNFLDRETFEDQLDQWITDGQISAEDKDAYLAQYDYCAEYGSGENGTRGTGMMGIRGGMGGSGSFMWDSEGNFLDRDSFENQLDQWITDGQINTENKDAYLAQYDYCAEYGGGSSGMGGTRGTGMMGIRGGNTDMSGNGTTAPRGNPNPRGNGMNASRDSASGSRGSVSTGSGSNSTSGSRGSSITGSRSNDSTGTRGNGAGSMGSRGDRSGGNGGGSGGAGRSGGGGRGR